MNTTVREPAAPLTRTQRAQLARIQRRLDAAQVTQRANAAATQGQGYRPGKAAPQRLLYAGTAELIGALFVGVLLGAECVLLLAGWFL
jgi:hypothetical protein